MRTWEGKEREGHEQGVLTLFVEALNVSDEQLDKLFDRCQKTGVRRLYFGAGRKPLEEMNAKLFTEYFGLGFTTVCEMPACHPKTRAWTEVFDRVIIRVDDEALAGADVRHVAMKLDTQREVYVYSSAPFRTSLQALKNGLYEGTDKEVEL